MSRYYQLRTEYLVAYAQGRAETWTPRLSGGDHQPDWPAEALALLTKLLAAKPPCSYSACASELHRRLNFKTDRASVRRWAIGQALHFYGVNLLYAPTPQAKGKSERRHDYWQKRLPPLLAADQIRELEGANRLLDQLLPHASHHEIHRQLGTTPNAAHPQALAEKRSVLRPTPACPWWPYVWSQQTRVRVDDDGKVPVGAQRQLLAAPPRSTVIRCLRPDGDSYYRRHAPDPDAKPIVLLHCPVF